MALDVAAFTDTYLPTVNGVTYTIDLWRARWNEGHGRLDVVYPADSDYEPRESEHPVRSVDLPIYRDQRLGRPRPPDDLPPPDIVHLHTPFTLGLAGLRYASRCEVPTVASYHTILAERIERFVTGNRLASTLEEVCHRYEAAIYDAVDLLITPTPSARQYVRRTIGPDTEIRVVSNGIDTRLFRPVDSGDLEARYGIDGSRPLVGYTGRHSHEKHLSELVAAVDGMDVQLVLAGDGPARTDLKQQAEGVDCEVVFPGFLDRGELPAFYSMLDVFAFCGRIETQGLVALEANACGTPVVAVDAGALAHTVVDGQTGYHYPPGDVAAFSEAIGRTITEVSRLREHCLERRELVSVEHTLDQLTRLYERLLDAE